MSATGRSKIGFLGLMWLTCACVLGMAGTLTADTIYVDDDAVLDPGPGDPTVSDPDEDGSSAHPFDAIQEGIDAALPGDEVVILDGTYTGAGNRDLDFGGKAITVRSLSDDPATCVIDCQADFWDPYRGFYFHSSETDESVVRGLTITGGYAGYDSPGYGGGGVYCSASSPTIHNCTIVDCGANSMDWGASGGGVYMSGGHARLSYCTIVDNVANGRGGGVYCDNGAATLVGCTIANNASYYPGYTAPVNGGGLCCSLVTGTITDCTITDNVAQGEWFGGGGGVSCLGGELTLTRCVIKGNRSTGDTNEGGGIEIYGAVTLIDCDISENDAGYGNGGNVYCGEDSDAALVNCTMSDSVAGCGVYCDECSPRFAGCKISGNDYGIHCYRADPVFASCEITGHSTNWNASAVYSRSNSAPVFTNCTFTGNQTSDPDGAAVFGTESDLTFTNCILWGNSPAKIVVESGTVEVNYSCVQGGWAGTGNLNLDPLLTLDRHLTADSFCLDTGDPAVVLTPGERDLDGHARVLRGRVDMGAYEFGIGDFDGDKQVDLGDFDSWFDCMTGPNAGPYGTGCEVFDFEFDEDVDLFDVAGFQQVFAGS